MKYTMRISKYAMATAPEKFLCRGNMQYNDKIVKDGGVVFWFASVVNKSNFVFSNLISNENENNDKVVGKLFLMIKSEPGFMGSLMYSLIKDMAET
jgi:hypothetical protein